jgi:putative membrane protein
MQKFFTIGKLLTLAFWILPLLALLGVFAPPWDYRLLAIAFVILLAHLGELAFVHGKLRTAGRAETTDILMVILVGLFHWMPILRKS